MKPADIDPPEIQAALWAGMDGGDWGFDVGANVGQSIPEMLSRCRKVVAFEPSPEVYGELVNVWGSHPFVTLRQLAVSSTPGRRIGLFPLEDGQLVSYGTHGITGDESTVLVEAATVDDMALLYGFPALVKVDTEGHEFHVLEGARLVLRRRQADWLIEFHNPSLLCQCREFLELAGYEPETVRHPYYEVGSVNWQQHGWIRALAPS